MEIRISSSIFLNNVILFANLYLRGIQRSNTSSYPSWWDPSLSGWDISRRHWGIIVTVSTWIRLILLVRNRAWVSLLGFIFSLFHKKRLEKIHNGKFFTDLWSRIFFTSMKICKEFWHVLFWFFSTITHNKKNTIMCYENVNFKIIFLHNLRINLAL